MRNLNIAGKWILAVIILFIIHSCLDYHVTTVVHPDGSLERFIKVTRKDSGAFDTGSMRIPSGPGWEITTGWETTIETEVDTAKNYVLSARKYFKSYQELNEELNQIPQEPGFVQIETSLDKKFRWFYTDLRYTETYKKYFPFHHFSIWDFLSENEFDYSIQPDEYIYSSQGNAFVRISDLEIVPELTHKDSLLAEELAKDIENKYKEWMARNIWQEFLSIVEEITDVISPETKESFLEKSDSIYKGTKFYDLTDKLTEEDFDTLLLQTYAPILNVEAWKLFDANREGFESFFEKLDKIFAPAKDSFTNTIVMPGDLIFTNATVSEENTCSWEIQFFSFLAEDFNMIAESRIHHKWALVTSILGASLLVIFIISLLFRMKKR